MKRFKGQIFIMSIVVLSSVMMVGLLLITAFTKGLRQANQSTDSLKAFYAADSGLEWELYKTFVNENVNKPTIERATIDTFNSFLSPSARFNSIKAVGEYGEVRRGLELYFEY